MKKAGLSMLAIVGALGASAANIPAGADLAEMNDYFYYTNAEHSAEGRANHTFQVGGLYTMSKECVWSSLTVASGIADPIVMDLGGHKLIGTGCDSSFRPLMGHNNVTIVISNGTFETVYDPTTYPWTISPNKYTSRRGAIISHGNDTAHDSTLIIAKDGNLTVESGTDSSVAFQGVRHRVIVEDGGTLNAKLSFHGKDNRYIFKKGATFSKISNYISSGKFPQGIWYENGYTSNIIEVCSSSFLTAAGVTALTPDAHAKAGSYHCGLSLSSPDFNWTCGGITIGNQSDNAPILFEMKDGAKVTASSEMHIGYTVGGSGSWVVLDGAGTLYKCSSGWAGRVGSVSDVTNTMLRISNGAFFDVSSSAFNVGYSPGTSYNAIEVLSGGHFAASSLGVGRDANYGNRVLVSGEGSTMTNGSLSVGNTQSRSCGRNSVTVSDYGDLYSGGTVRIGYYGGECLLRVDSSGKFRAAGSIALGDTGDKVAASSNRIEVCDGGVVTVATHIQGFGNNSTVVISNGTLTARQFFTASDTASLGTNNLLHVAGRNSLLSITDWGVNLKNGAKLKIDVPKNGFADSNGNVRAPLNIIGGISYDDDTTVDLDVSEFVASDSVPMETPLIYCSGGIPAALISRMDCGSKCSLVKSADGKTLTLKKRSGLILLLR